MKKTVGSRMLRLAGFFPSVLVSALLSLGSLDAHGDVVPSIQSVTVSKTTVLLNETFTVAEKGSVRGIVIFYEETASLYHRAAARVQASIPLRGNGVCITHNTLIDNRLRVTGIPASRTFFNREMRRKAFLYP
ncbi:MAG: hypothetical protein ABSG04_04720 [Verrucomicrobiota bacterium]